MSMQEDKFFPEDGSINLREIASIAMRTYRSSRRTHAHVRSAGQKNILYRYVLANLQKPIFIIGCSRSGTTFLGECLSQIPDVSYHLEPFASVAMNPPLVHGNWNPGFSRRFIRTYTGCLMRMHGEGDRIYVEKNPMNALSMGAILNAFPDARFLHLIRDGRDVSLSISRRWPPNLYTVPEAERENYRKMNPVLGGAKIWKMMARQAREDGKKLPADQYLEVRLEDIAQDPVRKAGQILNFMSVSNPDSQKKLQENLAKVEASRMGKWKDSISVEDRSLLEKELNETLAEFGYV